MSVTCCAGGATVLVETAADGCRSVTELPRSSTVAEVDPFRVTVHLLRVIRTTVTKWSGPRADDGQKAHTPQGPSEESPALLHFRTGPYHAARASVKCEYRFNNNTDIHCSKGQRAEPDNPANMTLSELL